MIAGVRLRELSPGVYAAMKPDGEHFLYGLVTVYPDGIITYHQPDCRVLNEAARGDYGVVESTEEPGLCRVERWENLSGALLTYVGAVGGEPRIDGVYRRLD